MSPLHPLYGLLRDLMLPVLFVGGLRGNDFVWRGNTMQVERMLPVRIAVRLRPRMHELATLT